MVRIKLSGCDVEDTVVPFSHRFSLVMWHGSMRGVCEKALEEVGSSGITFDGKWTLGFLSKYGYGYLHFRLHKFGVVEEDGVMEVWDIIRG